MGRGGKERWAKGGREARTENRGEGRGIGKREDFDDTRMGRVVIEALYSGWVP